MAPKKPLIYPKNCSPYFAAFRAASTALGGRRRHKSMATFALLAAWLATAAVDLTEDTFDQHVGKRLHSIVEFHAPWCTACAAFSPVLDSAIKELVRERPDLQFMRVDGDAQPELRERFQIEEAPSLLLFPAGAPGSRAAAAHFTGELNQAELTEWARASLSSLPLLSQSSRASRTPSASPAKAARPAKPTAPAKPATPTAQRELDAARAAEYHAAELLRLLQQREGELRDVERQLLPLLQQRVALAARIEGI